jgi:hypothetical protein
MNMIDFRVKVEDLKKTLTIKDQRLLSLKSIENFILYYDNLVHFKTEVYNLIKDYFNTIEKETVTIDKHRSREIANKYIMKIGAFYRVDLGFKFFRPLSAPFFWGLQIDILLLLIGILKNLHYIPLATIFLLLNWLYIKFFFENKNKVFGIMY